MRFAILLFIFCSSVNLMAQNALGDNGERYKIAYDYLLSDSKNSERNYIVSDTLMFMERSPFWKYFQKNGESSFDCITRIDSIDNINRYTKEYSRELVKLFGSVEETPNLYFSKISDNVLFAEYFYRFGLNKDLSQAPIKYNGSYRYLFVFGSDNSIADVLKQVVAYK